MHIFNFVTPHIYKIAHIVDQRNTLHVQMFAIKRVLQQTYDIVAYRILGGKALRPRENLSLGESSLLHRETEGEAKGHSGLGWN